MISGNFFIVKVIKVKISIKGFTCSDGWAMALANNGEMYTWGANNVGLYIDDWSQAFVIDKPLRIHPISG